MSYSSNTARSLRSDLPLWVKAGVHLCPQCPSNMPLLTEPRCKPCAPGVRTTPRLFPKRGRTLGRDADVFSSGVFALRRAVCRAPKLCMHATKIKNKNNVCVKTDAGFHAQDGPRCAEASLLCSSVTVLLLRSQSSPTEVNGCLQRGGGGERERGYAKRRGGQLASLSRSLLPPRSSYTNTPQCD